MRESLNLFQICTEVFSNCLWKRLLHIFRNVFKVVSGVRLSGLCKEILASLSVNGPTWLLCFGYNTRCVCCKVFGWL